ncbi:MAG: hypothetical protein ACP5LG_02755 [Conexivisphaera sp.]
MELKPFIVGFQSGASPARGLIASALLDKVLKDRYGGRVPLRSVVVVSNMDAYVDKVVGRVLEALSKAGVDVPPSRIVGEEPDPPPDLYLAFTREELRGLEDTRAYLLGDLAGLPDREVEDTLGDFSQLTESLSDLVERAVPSLLILSRYKHAGDVVGALEDLIGRYRTLGREVLNLPGGFSSVAAAMDALEEALIGLSAPDGPVRRYAEAYGNVCTCGGTMQLVSERYRDGVYELTFACDRCGRRVIRYH